MPSPRAQATTPSGRIVARTTVEGEPVTVPARDRSCVVRDGDRLFLPDGTTAGCSDARESETGVDCDSERTARTEYVQTVCAVDGVTSVLETACSTVR
ncbi:hypothetical protein [Halapricum desulfuricans]|uniref:Uncharacterized protein n=1 Tax=Halapricum desulfuricans TaxID=2841257 RepID=A0A897N9Q9_9EURY|nr:hypothetical protein [Halapricum desulfuricans]QSG07116.1 hypothetical protein HSR121_2796 [Halapricum desulfuricans]